MSSSETGKSSIRIGGSFRDPSGYVFWNDGKVYRAIDDDCHATINSLHENGTLAKLIADGSIVGTRFVDDENAKKLSLDNPGFTHFFQHDVITPITYPYEWSVSMLADAGVLTLDLQCQLIEQGASLKDATAYNVQFENGKATFIDIASIERPRRFDVWYALGQFGQMFTFPLLLCRYQGWDLHSYFLANLGGRNMEQVAHGMGLIRRWGPRVLLDVTLPMMLGRLGANRPQSQPQDIGQAVKRGDNSQAQLINLKRLRGKIAGLAKAYKPSGVWAEYTEKCTYDGAAEDQKKMLVKQHLDSVEPRRVLDLGCNTGDYSYIAAAANAQVFAVDNDHDAVEILYRRLRQEPATITPAVVDILNPSPAIGFRNHERDSFEKRVDAECVLALALIHHLLVSGNLSLSQIRDVLYDLTQKYVILEYIPIDDAMFERLLRFRTDDFSYLSLDHCRNVFSDRFELISEDPILGSPRTLLFLKKKT